MTYHQITSEERYTIAALRREGFSFAQIGRRLGRHRSTISRELSRNASAHDGSYRPSVADRLSGARRWRSRRNRQFSSEEFEVVEELLREDLSPEQISGWLYLTGGLEISHETIYRYVWEDKARGGSLYLHLRGSSKKRRKRHNSYDSRGRLAGKKHISERPASAESRKEVGHWEGDTVVGGKDKDCITTLVERKTGFALIGKLSDRSKLSTSDRLIEMILYSKVPFKSITLDNGTEFHDYKRVEEETGVPIYFATPYHSWERGTNENFNGLVRQYLPKRKSQRHITQADCDDIASRLNDRPRKRLGFHTPREVLFGK